MKKYLFTALSLVLFGGFFIAQNANASVIYSTFGSPNAVSASPTASIVQYQWTAPVGASGVPIKGIIMYTNSSSCTLDANNLIRIQSAQPGAEPWNSFVSFTDTTTELGTWFNGKVCRYSYNAGITLTAGNVYNLHLSSQTGQGAGGYSTNIESGTVANWSGANNNASSFTTSTPLDLAFMLCDDVLCSFETSATTTAITQINTPLGGTISTSTNVIFDFEYFNSGNDIPEYQYAGIDLIDTSNGGTQVAVLNQGIDATGYDSFHTTVDLISNHTYIWRPFLMNASSTLLYGDFNIFNVVSNPAGQSVLELPFATSTATSSDPLMYLNVVTAIQNKYPLSYIPQIINLVRSEATMTGTSTFPKIQVDFTNTVLGTTTMNLGVVELFSTTTITHFLTSNQINTFKTLIGYILWVGFIFFLIRDIRNIILKTTI